MLQALDSAAFWGCKVDLHLKLQPARLALRFSTAAGAGAGCGPLRTRCCGRNRQPHTGCAVQAHKRPQPAPHSTASCAAPPQGCASSCSITLPRVDMQLSSQCQETAWAMQPDMARAAQASSSQPPPPPATPIDLDGPRWLPQGRGAGELAAWVHGEGHMGGPRQAGGAAPLAPR